MQDKAERSIVSLKEAIVTGLVLDFLLLVLAGSIMDNGMIAIIALSIGAGHWAGNIMILIFNRSRQTRWDRDFIRFGFLVLIPVAAVIAAAVAFFH